MMGTPLSDDILWVCDKCRKSIPKGTEFRPDPNEYTSYHKECMP